MDNPFAADDSDNPFADPSVQQAQQSVPEYNPFEQPASKPAPTSDAVGQGASAFGQPTAAAAAPPPPAAAAPSGGNDIPSWAQPTPSSPPPQQQQQQQHVSQQPQAGGGGPDEATLAAATTLREIEYAERQRKAAMQEKMATTGRPPNFPNFPEWMRVGCVKPCFHLDFKGEIPVIGQKVTRLAYYAWMLLVFTLFWNFVCTLAALAGNPKGKSVSCALSAAYFLLFSPCSYYCWFHQMYSAMRVDSSMRFGWFFFVMGFQFLTSSFFAVGFEKTGAAGIIVAAKVVDNSASAGILVFTGAGLWIFNALIQLYIIKRVLNVYRMSGFTAADMQREAITSAASNQAVRNAAVSAATGQR